MWRFLDSVLGLIFEFIHWLVFVKLTNWEKERLRRMGVKSQEELDELVRQRCEARTSQISPEQEAEFLCRHPQILEAFRQREGTGSPRESPGPRPSDLDDDQDRPRWYL
ncbi:hypothetical protein NW759_002117 [Fusarium solani]|nr:hypothetical protein NW759_002117 [Fusarium solani]